MNEPSNKSPRLGRKSLASFMLCVALVLVPALPSSAVGLVGSLDGNQGTLMMYGQFRYKPATNPTYVTVSSWSPRYNGAVNCGAYIRLGLRNSSDTQVTPTYQWNAPGAQKRFLTNGGSNLASGVYYAFNGRTSYTGSTDLCGTVTWHGSLAL